jgi:hypothetical protein
MALEVDHINYKSKWGPNSLKCTKLLSQCHLFKKKLLSHFFPCKDTFMDDYDWIYNFDGLKYNPFENFDNFWLILFNRDQNKK